MCRDRYRSSIEEAPCGTSYEGTVKNRCEFRVRERDGQGYNITSEATRVARGATTEEAMLMRLRVFNRSKLARGRGIVTWFEGSCVS